MNVGQLVMPNKKGQVVIPSTIRKQLGITPDVPLKFSVMGGGIYVYPMKVTPRNIEHDDSLYLEILKKTQGSWGPETAEEKKARIKQRKLELEASKRRKNAW